MPARTALPRTAAYKPGLSFFAGFGSAWVFVLVTLGAFTTSIGAGMAFPDWPLSDGSVNPHGWLSNLSMFAEHSHRLSGTTMGLITIALAFWLWRTEARPWLRQLGWWALAIVVVQGILGGTRVLLDPVHVPGFQMTLGQMLRIPHGVLAQVFVCVLFAIAASCSRGWIERPRPVSTTVRRLGVACVALLFLQLTIAATMRHNNAGLAIPTFPRSTPGGDWLPAAWDFRVALNFAHRVMALVLTIALSAFAIGLWFGRGITLGMRCAASVMISLLALQILLGAHVIWDRRQPHITTGHVACGALLLAVTFCLTWFAHRDVIEGGAGLRPASPAPRSSEPAGLASGT
ncbi:MAG TPA: COX15/CtaA family protein [Opitutus sp.]|nr:COX15/CtaA family protein [Opitutus sp.]